jgi:hypothetical protein
MADVYLIETITETDQKFGDSLNTDLHGGMTILHTLQHLPQTNHPSFLIIQTNEFIDSHDNPVSIVRAPSGGADWVLIGHLTRGAKTHLIEISAPAVLEQRFQVNIQTHSISGHHYGDPNVDPGELDDFGITAVQVLYRPI